MPKLILQNITNLQNESTVTGAINANNAATTTALENTLSRDGSTPNNMNAVLDMNSNRIINLPQATSPTEPVRLQEVGDAPAYSAAAAASAAASLSSANDAAASALSSGSYATASASSATASANSATQAQGYVAGLSGTSTSSVTIGTGSKSFTTQTNKLWAAGQFVTVTSSANSANYMHGTVTSYDSGTGALVVNVLDIGGSGTLASWNITISGTQGSQGPQGNQGPSGAVGVSGTPTANQFATWNSSTVIQGVSITGLVKGNGASAPTAAVAGTDYQAPLSAATNSTAGIVKVSTAASTATGTATDEAVRVVDAAAVYSAITRLVNTQSGTTYTLVLADAGKLLYFTSASAVTVTVPPNSSVALPVNTQIDILQQGAGKVTLAQGAGVTINSIGSNKAISAQYGGVTLIKTATDTWTLFGNLTA